MLFRSNDTATTEIYTLSLHDALPILINQRTSSGICLTCLFDVGERYDVEIDMLDSGDSRTTIFMFYDEEIKLNDEVFEFRFANEV